ncbi:MAG: SMC-Scp complex subunit ScpB [Cyanobacteria bacterium J083]|nr:MAG: SMC-Scp complex subunit ScpB [Cyanobacteria bacterium J083]
MELAAKIEAILYLKGKPLNIDEIAEFAGLERDLVEEALIELINDYAYRNSALEIKETNQGYSLELRPLFQDLLPELVPPEIGTGSLRTLAAIALKNPILQTELIELRGSSAYQQVGELVELGFIRKKRQPAGRSYWLEITDKFHQYFEIEKLSQILP